MTKGVLRTLGSCTMFELLSELAVRCGPAEEMRRNGVTKCPDKLCEDRKRDGNSD